MFTTPPASRLHLKKPTATDFFFVAASRWRMIIDGARVSTTEQNLGLRHDDLKPAFDDSVDPTDAGYYLATESRRRARGLGPRPGSVRRRRWSRS